jgi:preprotein translocase subunit SecF
MQKSVVEKKNSNKGSLITRNYNVDFMGMTKIFSPLGIVSVLLALGLIFGKGFKYGIDYAGGTEIQVKFTEKIDTNEVRTFVESAGFTAVVQTIGNENEFLIRMEQPERATEKETNAAITEMVATLTTKLKQDLASKGPEVRRVDSVGPQVGSELKRNAVLSIFYCLLAILIYVGLRFDYRYSTAAVFCLFHDAVVTLGLYALFDWEVSIQTLAAILTLVGYSLNDTIVIFDRVRENQDIHRDKPLAWIFNHSINEMLGRTILTSVTTFSAVAALYFLTEGAIKDFALTMGIGIIIGVYSTVYVASPLVAQFDALAKLKKAKV